MTARLALLTACALAFGLGGTALAAAPAQTPPGTETERPDVDELTERFPIGTETVNEGEGKPTGKTEGKTADKREPAVPPAATVPVDDAGSGLPQATIVLAVGTALFLALLGAGALAVRRARAEEAPIWSSTPNLALLYQTLASGQESDKFPTDHTTRRSLPVTEVAKERNEPQPGRPAQAEGVTPKTPETPKAPAESAESLSEHRGVVEQISAMLQAAEAAATAIRAEAVNKAEEITQAAVKEGQAQLAQMREQAVRIRSEAEQAAKEAQEAAESFGARQRREAEQRVEQLLAQAEGQARATRQAAEEMARQIEATAREREEKLKAQMRPLETSLRRALDAFRSITAQLEDLLDGEKTREDQTLTDALGGQVRQAGEREEAPAPQQRTNG
jgi:hypothetical protein